MLEQKANQFRRMKVERPVLTQEESEIFEVKDEEEEEDFEAQWTKLEKLRGTKQQTVEKPLEQSFMDHSSQGLQLTLQSDSTQKQPQNMRGWETSWNKNLREEKRKIQGETSFMDINDSFAIQFNGLIQNFECASVEP